LLVAPAALAAVSASEPRRVKVVDARPPATSMRTRMEGLVAVPTITNELVTSKTAQEGEFSPELRVRVAPTFVSVFRFTLTILPGDVDVPTKAVPVAGSETAKAALFSPVARVSAAGDVT